QYYACREPERWRGCGQEPARLIHLTEADLLPLPGCVLDVQYKNGEFHAQIRPGYRCEFEYQGQKRQVDIGWRVNPTTFISYDRGVDPQTGQALWGALMGPYIFQKRE
ncbi:MAG: CpcT/CpeT family chromophore lyase, partial [Gloeomargarita sp. SKYBB_i_bin120]|nr:chromophore lyase CpcT/CpeT [Gloeomargarita sp. SKYB120]MDW8178485.1 CpcT/CpeT family chromophore lyase [Gloeomargarita sp. SKYBB_i_bin120]